VNLSIVPHESEILDVTPDSTLVEVMIGSTSGDIPADAELGQHHRWNGPARFEKRLTGLTFNAPSASLFWIAAR